MTKPGVFTRGRQYIALPNELRFWRQVRKSDGCWTWVGAKNENGYGTFKERTDTGSMRTVKAHRFAYFLAHGFRLESSTCVLHVCDTPDCVNPAHLARGTQIENIADMKAKGRASNQLRGRKSCIHGHLFNDANTHVRKNGKRECRECMRQRMRARRAAARAR